MAIDIGREMALPMEQIIGGPLQSVITAQALAASTTAEFIQTVGLTSNGNGDGAMTARTVAFSFDRERPKADGSGTEHETVNLNVPLLTIVPIPFIRVKEATIDFEAKVSSNSLSTRDTSFGVDASASGGFWGVKFSVKASYSQQTKQSETVNKSATLTMHVDAVQDEMPGGLAKVLDLLETAITEQETPVPAALPA